MHKEKTNELNSKIIPIFQKVLVILCLLSYLYLFTRGVVMPPISYYGMPFGVFMFLLVGVILVSFTFVVLFLGFPQSKFTNLIRWGIRFSRNFIILMAICGFLRLLVTNYSPLSIRAGILYFNLIAVVILALVEKPLPADQKTFPLHFKNKLTFTPKQNSALTLTLCFVAAALPVCITLAIIHWGYRSTLSNFRPFNWNDQTAYWTLIRSFSQFGFNTGYSVNDQSLAPASFGHSGFNSPVFIYLYGSIAKLVGWSPQLPLIINFCFLALGIFVFIRAVRLNPLQITLTLFVILLVWPILLFLPTSSQEPLHQTIGILLAGIFFLLMTKGKKIKPFPKVLFCIFIFLASLIRLSWTLLFFPLIFWSINTKLSRRVILTLGLGSILLLGSVLITSYLLPQSNFSVFTAMQSASRSGISGILGYASIQVKYVLNQWNPQNRIIICELFVLVFWRAFELGKLIRQDKLNVEKILLTPQTFDIYNLLSLLAGGVFAYYSDNFYRTFVPTLLVTLLLLVAQKNYKPVMVTLLVFNIFIVGLYLPLFPYWKINFEQNSPSIVQSTEVLAKYVIFDHDTKNPWCNTVILSINDYDYRVALIPPGIGVSNVHDEYISSHTLKSKYLLFDQALYERNSDHLNVKFLTALPEGNLYYNFDSGCK